MLLAIPIDTQTCDIMIIVQSDLLQRFDWYGDVHVMFFFIMGTKNNNLKTNHPLCTQFLTHLRTMGIQ